MAQRLAQLAQPRFFIWSSSAHSVPTDWTMPALRTMKTLPLRWTICKSIRMLGCWLTHCDIFHFLRILEESIMGLQCPPAAGASNFSKCTPHHPRSVGATELETSKVGKTMSFETKPHRLPTRTAPGQKGQRTGNRRPHKSPGGKGQSRQSAPCKVTKVVRKVQSFKWNR
jgi:hypothetical protein